MLGPRANRRVSSIKLLTKATSAEEVVVKTAKTVPFCHPGEALSFPPCLVFRALLHPQ